MSLNQTATAPISIPTQQAPAESQDSYRPLEPYTTFTPQAQQASPISFPDVTPSKKPEPVKRASAPSTFEPQIYGTAPAISVQQRAPQKKPAVKSKMPVIAAVVVIGVAALALTYIAIRD